MGEKNKKPNIRFKNFTGNWESHKLGDIVSITMGQSPDGATYSSKKSNYILVQGNADLQNGWVEPRVWTTQKTKTADAGDLILSVRAPAGAIGKTKYDVVIGRGVAAIKGNEFIYQKLYKMNEDDYWTKFSCGSTFDSINSDSINNAEIMIPSKEEQKQIGLFFNNLDRVIEKCYSEFQSLQNVKKSLLQKMFPENNEDKPKVRFKGFTDAWEQRIVGNCISSIPTKEYIVVPQTRGRYPVYQQGDNPIAGYTDEKPCEYINVILFGDHTLSIYRPESPYMLATDGIKILKSEIFDNVFFMHYLEKYKPISEGYKRHFSILRNMPSYYPLSTKEQKNVGLLFNYIDSLITLHQRKYEKLQNIKKSLLERMFI